MSVNLYKSENKSFTLRGFSSKELQIYVDENGFIYVRSFNGEYYKIIRTEDGSHVSINKYDSYHSPEYFIGEKLSDSQFNISSLYYHQHRMLSSGELELLVGDLLGRIIRNEMTINGLRDEIRSLKMVKDEPDIEVSE